jgi:hypothetical protein
MAKDPIHGKTIRWTFDDGPVAGKTYEHTFEKGGAVTFRAIGGDDAGKPSRVEKSEVAEVGEDVFAVSYLGSSGYTLTVVLDYRTDRLVAFASNEKELVLQTGTFETL